VFVPTTRAVGALSAFALAVLVLPAVLLADVRRNDFFQFWWVGHLVVSGRSPYEPASFRDALVYGTQAGSVYTSCAVSVQDPLCLWVYPPWTPWLYAPIGLLDRPAGTIAVLVLAVVSLAVGIALITRWAAAPLAGSALIALGLSVSAPAVRDVVLGHFEGLLLIGLVSLAAGLAAHRAGLVAGVVLLALKPHLVVVLAPISAAWLVARRMYRALAMAAATLGILVLSAVVLEPRGLGAMLGRSGVKVGFSGSTTWDLAGRIGGVAWPLIALLLLGIAVVGALAAWRSADAAERPRVLVAIGVALGLAVVPYAQSYDDVLLFPVFALTLRGARVGTIAAACAVMVAVTWGAYLLELDGDPRAYAGAFPVVALALLGAVGAWPYGRARRSNTKRSFSPSI